MPWSGMPSHVHSAASAGSLGGARRSHVDLPDPWSGIWEVDVAALPPLLLRPEQVSLDAMRSAFDQFGGLLDDECDQEELD